MKNNILAAAVIGTLIPVAVLAVEVKGRVQNQNAQPVSDAKVIVRSTSQSAITDNNGEFILELDQGTYAIDIEAGTDGHFHEEIQVKGNDPIIIAIERHQERKVVITANPLEHTKLDMAAPAILLTGEELAMKRAGTLGDILLNEPGISMSSFGPAVARPVIRGLSGSRVRVTSNRMNVQDASTTSADHDVGVEPLLAEQIEVLKGPATLIYGSGAIGGVVNVTDRRINPDGSLELTGGIELRLGDAATGEQSLVATFDGGTSNWLWHFDGYTTDTDDLSIPGGAESEILHEREGHADADGDESEGQLENSQSETQGATLGATNVTDWGYWGLAINRIDKTYGVPGHAEHTTPADPNAPEEEGVFIEMKQTRYDLQSEINNPFAHFNNLFVGYSYTDYQHQEIEGDEPGTEFNNKAWELRTHLKHESLGGWNGIIGLQLDHRNFSAEAPLSSGHAGEIFVPPSNAESTALFLVEEKTFDAIKWELGARLEKNRIKADGFKAYQQTLPSLSAGWVYSFDHQNKLAMNLSQSARSASVEELFSEGPHHASQTFEVGNGELKKETSLNLDISYRFNNDWVNGEINLYHNQFSNFIYGAPLPYDTPLLPLEIRQEAEAEELQLIYYQQEDARVSGVEIDVHLPLIKNETIEFSVGFMGDLVEAEFDTGEYIPRIPPLKYGVNLHTDIDSFSASLNWTHYDSQNHVFRDELPTRGFEMLDMELAYRIVMDNSDLFLFLRGKNLLDEDARDHASLLKDLAPRAGRNFVTGIQYHF